MQIERKDFVLKIVRIMGADEFTYINEYLDYLQDEKQKLIEQYPNQIISIKIESEEGWGTERLKYSLVVVRDETDGELKTRVNDLLIKREKQEKLNQEKEIKLLKDLQAKYGE